MRRGAKRLHDVFKHEHSGVIMNHFCSKSPNEASRNVSRGASVPFGLPDSQFMASIFSHLAPNSPSRHQSETGNC